jgi:RNA polymerase sigma-70 factor (ECF subfamily)
MTATRSSPLGELYRQHAGVLTASVVRLLGPGRLDRAEAVVQDAFVAALETWHVSGPPDNPAAWLVTVARHRALDELRAERRRAGRTEPLDEAAAARLETAASAAAGEAPAREPPLRHELADDELRMMFVACHPALTLESQVALTLRTLCGLETAEIAGALLVDEAAVEKRLVRARQVLRGAGVAFDLPPPAELEARLDAVLRVLYLLFSEGYSAHAGERPIRKELCTEAMRLGDRLLGLSLTDTPTARALDMDRSKSRNPASPRAFGATQAPPPPARRAGS